MNVLTYIWSPPQNEWWIGPLPIRAYALCIIAGIFVALWLSSRRWVARGGKPGQISDIALWAVPFGIVGGRLYHVITDNDLYFGPGRDPWHAFFIWDGGLGIWGAVALGGLGAWIGARRQGMKMPPLADAIAPGLVLAQGDRPLGQLVQPGALRPADHAALGAEDRPRPPAARLRAVPDVPADLPLRVDLGRRGGVPRDLARPEVQDRPRPGLRPLRRLLHRRPGLDRVPADRPGARRRRLRAAAQRLDLDGGVPRRHDVLPRQPPAASGARGDGAAGDRCRHAPREPRGRGRVPPGPRATRSRRTLRSLRARTPAR